jgi:hypothetical protein
VESDRCGGEKTEDRLGFASRSKSHRPYSTTLLQLSHVGSSWKYMTVWPMRPSLATRLVRTPTRNAASAAAAAAATVKAAPTPATLCHSKLDTHPVVATPIPSRSPRSHVWFSSSAPYSLPDSGLEGDHKPTDERTLKLGKSMFSKHWAYLSTCSNKGCNSYPYPSRTPSYSARIAATTRNTLSTNLTPSVPLDTPTSADRVWKNRLPRCTMDGACSLGKSACSGQCQTHSHL